MSDQRRPRESVYVTVACLIASLAPVAVGVTRGVQVSHLVSPAEMQPGGGFAVTTTMPPGRLAPLFAIDGDSPTRPDRSLTLLVEDGRLLPFPHAQHEEIRQLGGGRYSHWATAVYFAASDSSDPRTNGRSYVLESRAFLSFWAAWAWAIALVAAVWRASANRLAAGRSASQLLVMASAALVGSFGVLAAGYLNVSRRELSAPVELTLWLLALGSALVVSASCGARLARIHVPDTPWRTGRVRSLLLGTAAAVVVGCARLTGALGALLGRPGPAGLAIRALAIAAPFLAFDVLLRTRWPQPWLVASHDGVVAISLVTAPVLALAQRRTDRLGHLLGVSITLALFAMPLAARWQDAAAHANAIGGLLPFSDASGYYHDARRLLEGQALTWSARRPQFPGLLAVLFAVFDHDLRQALAALVALNAVSTYLFARQVSRLAGVAGGVAATLLMFFFYRFDGGLGTVLTENMGLAVGALGMTVLLGAAQVGSLRAWMIGVALTTIALMSRAGAFFALPALVAVSPIVFTGRRGRAVAATAGAVVVAAALALTSGRAVSSPSGEQRAFSNFSYSLYGLVVGGKGWAQTEIDHPGVKEGAEVYALALQAFLNRPMGLVEGSLRMWRAYLDVSQPYHAFAFIREPAEAQWLYWACYVLSALGLMACLRRPVRPWGTVVVAMAIGHIASIPFVPPIDAGLRVYAATVSVLPVLVAIGMGVAVRVAAATRYPWRADIGGLPLPDVPARLPSAALALGCLTVTAALGAPIVLLSAGRVPPAVADRCAGDGVPLQLRIPEGSFLVVTPDDRPPEVSPTAIRSRDLAKTLGIVELKGDLRLIGAGTVLAHTYDERDGRVVWLVAPTRLLPSPPGRYAVCAHGSGDGVARQYGLFYADTVRPVGE